MLVDPRKVQEVIARLRDIAAEHAETAALFAQDVENAATLESMELAAEKTHLGLADELEALIA